MNFGRLVVLRKRDQRSSRRGARFSGRPCDGRGGLGYGEVFGLNVIRRNSYLGEQGLDRVHHQWWPTQVDPPRRKIGNRLREPFLTDASAGALPVCPLCVGDRDRDEQLRIQSLQRGDFVRKNEIGGRAARVNEEDVSCP